MSSPSRVSSFSRTSNSARAASQSSRVPTLCFVIRLVSFFVSSPSSEAGGNCDTKRHYRQCDRHVESSMLGQDLLRQYESGDQGHPGDAHDTQRDHHEHQTNARADADEAELEARAHLSLAATAAGTLERRQLVEAG